MNYEPEDRLLNDDFNQELDLDVLAMLIEIKTLLCKFFFHVNLHAILMIILKVIRSFFGLISVCFIHHNKQANWSKCTEFSKLHCDTKKETLFSRKNIILLVLIQHYNNKKEIMLGIRGFPKVDHSANIARIVLVDQLLN